jgi:hypothetical protein
MLAGNVNCEMGKLEKADFFLQQALELAQSINADNFSAQSLHFLAQNSLAQGDKAKAQVYALQGVEIVRKVGVTFIGPALLAIKAALSHDQAVAQEALKEAEAILDSGCVSHNHFYFTRTAIGCALQAHAWDEVERYAMRPERPSRDEEEVWKVFRAPLEKRHVIKYLAPKKIVAPNYDYEFERARKNEVWHAYEPISFDLAEADSIKDKANRWLGRVTSLADSNERFTLHLLMGKPGESKLQTAYVQAQNILNKMPVKHEFVQEDEAEEFAESLTNEIKEHGG